MNKLFTYLLLITISLIFACSPSTKYTGKNSSLTIDSTLTNHELAEDLIKPYKDKLDAEMNEVLVISSEEFPKEKGKPETKLGNLVSDLSLKIANQHYQTTDWHNIDFCLLNFGGLRTSLPKGPITRGKIFELMPFENELVVVTITKENFYKLAGYIKNVEGQPIGGDLKLMFKDTMTTFTVGNRSARKNITKVLTTDYLAKGGDNMTFFANPIKYEKVGIKLRDAIIQYCQEQHQQGKQLVGKLDGRITFE